MTESEPRQRIVRVAGSRRAKLTPVAGSEPEPAVARENDEAAVSSAGAKDTAASGPNDARLRNEVPPHY
ncbi:hypothetical protein GCM10017596_14810 [Microbacterium keratanolyticum]|uniref:Uncharacterized protein n=1 Tax=Microbacterium keratanolyticum TaxID=67574 RepID=A0A9W6HRW5_9MICO|nr:hypothetical protein GCM10017596_14810 [Microbacterium keratanolyticum]